MFDWNQANIAHIARHDVLPHEAEEAYNSNPLYLDYLIEDGEERHHEIGETLAGRILVVVSTMRGRRCTDRNGIHTKAHLVDCISRIQGL
jgi:uncharacterized DUF497 family protein